MVGWTGYWVRVYRARIAFFLERCRNCGTLPGQKGLGNILTLDHLVARSRGGTHAMTNAIILCRGCNQRKADKPAPQHWRSLAQEEAAAPPERRWSKLPMPEPPAEPQWLPSRAQKRRKRSDPAADEREIRKRAGRPLRRRSLDAKKAPAPIIEVGAFVVHGTAQAAPGRKLVEPLSPAGADTMEVSSEITAYPAATPKVGPTSIWRTFKGSLAPQSTSSPCAKDFTARSIAPVQNAAVSMAIPFVGVVRGLWGAVSAGGRGS